MSYEGWLSSGAHANEDEEIYIEERISELLKLECDPNRIGNVCEAIGEDCLYNHKEQIEEAMRTRDFVALGRLLWGDVFEYWENMAMTIAQDEVEQGL